MEKDIELKNRHLAKKLDTYMVENNKELYKYLFDRGELRDFLLNRSNMAFDAYKDAIVGGMASPDEVSNKILFCGIENSYREYIESLLSDNFFEFFTILESKPVHKQNNVLENIVFSCMDIFYEYLSVPYEEAMEKLDEKLIERLSKQTEIIKL